MSDPMAAEIDELENRMLHCKTTASAQRLGKRIAELRRQRSAEAETAGYAPLAAQPCDCGNAPWCCGNIEDAPC